MAITTRATSGAGVTAKGSPLTVAELDTNFIELATKAPKTNPTNGGPNYAPKASPTFTGTVSIKDDPLSAAGLSIINDIDGYSTITNVGCIDIKAGDGIILSGFGGGVHLDLQTNYDPQENPLGVATIKNIEDQKNNPTFTGDIIADTQSFADNAAAGVLAPGTIYRATGTGAAPIGTLMIKY